MGLQVLLSAGAGVGLQPDVQAGVQWAVHPLITPTEEAKLPAAFQDDWSQGQKDALGLDTLERKNKMKRISKTEEPLRTVQNHKARNK